MHPTNGFCPSCHKSCQNPTLFRLQLPAVTPLVTSSPRSDAAPTMPHPSPALNLTTPRLPVCTPVVSMEVLHYLQEVPMATDTLTKPVIAGGTTTTKVFKNFIDGEWVESTSGQTFEDRNPAATREVLAIFQPSNTAH